MITKIQISPRVGVFHVKISLNSWEVPEGKLYLNSQVLITDFLVDDSERLVLPRREGKLYCYQLPSGHRCSFSYQLQLEPGKNFFFIEDDGSYLPHFGQDNPPRRETQITLPEDLIALSDHKLDKIQRRRGLLRFFFEGEGGGVFVLGGYYGERIFSGELYFLNRALNSELLNRYLREAWDYMYKNYGDKSLEGQINYICLPEGLEAFTRKNSIFFHWPDKEKPRAFEELVESYLALSWSLDSEDYLVQGLLHFFLAEIAKNFYSKEELEDFYREGIEAFRRLEKRPLKELVARDLSLGFWFFLEELRDFLGGEVFYPIMKLILQAMRIRTLGFEELIKTFSELSWKEGTREFLEKRIYGD